MNFDRAREFAYVEPFSGIWCAVSRHDMRGSCTLCISFHEEGGCHIIAPEADWVQELDEIIPYWVGAANPAMPWHDFRAHGLPMKSFCIHTPDTAARFKLVEFDDAYDRRSAITPIWPGLAIRLFTRRFFGCCLRLERFRGRCGARLGGFALGQCALCGHSLHENTSDQCPECGTAVRWPH